jgi:hypothetical protein
MAGYMFVFRYLNLQSSQNISQKIDSNNYSSGELVEIKVALHLPYQSTMSDYELHSGEITIAGSHHNYVKRKVSGDTLYLLCLPNREKDKLQVAESNFNKDANDFDASGKKESAIKKAPLFADYNHELTGYLLNPPADEFSGTNGFLSAALLQTFPDFPGRPPEINS